MYCIVSNFDTVDMHVLIICTTIINLLMVCFIQFMSPIILKRTFIFMFMQFQHVCGKMTQNKLILRFMGHSRFFQHWHLIHTNDN